MYVDDIRYVIYFIPWSSLLDCIMKVFYALGDRKNVQASVLIRKYIERNVLHLPEVIWMMLMSWRCMWLVCHLYDYCLCWQFLNSSCLLRPRTLLVIVFMSSSAVKDDVRWRICWIGRNEFCLCQPVFPEGIKHSFQVLIDVGWFCVNDFPVVLYLGDYFHKHGVWKSVSPEF